MPSHQDGGHGGGHAIANPTFSANANNTRGAGMANTVHDTTSMRAPNAMYDKTNTLPRVTEAMLSMKALEARFSRAVRVTGAALAVTLLLAIIALVSGMASLLAS